MGVIAEPHVSVKNLDDKHCCMVGSAWTLNPQRQHPAPQGLLLALQSVLLRGLRSLWH
jgi:hypothetical protein